jgi:hypothetical protein
MSPDELSLFMPPDPPAVEVAVGGVSGIINEISALVYLLMTIS